jgi:ELWxxDGT repeat protein
VLGKSIYFGGDDGTTGFELWKSDGTAAGTTLVKNLQPYISGTEPRSSLPQNFVTVDNRLFFITQPFAAQPELWITDGTEAGTVRITGVTPYVSSSSYPGMAALNGKLFFVAADPASSGRPSGQVWTTDGTQSGTHLLVNVGNTIGTKNITTGITTFDDHLVFVREGDDVTLYRSDGTAAGTQPITQLYADPGYVSGVGRSGNRIFISASNQILNTANLWVTDGTAAGTHVVGPAYLDYVGSAGAIAYFRQAAASSLWRSDGTLNGTFDLMLPANVVRGGAAIGDTFYFTATDSAHGTEIWKTDGAVQGTTLAIDVQPGPAGSTPQRLHASGNTLFFSADTTDVGSEERAFHPTSGSIQVVRDAPGTADSDPAVLLKIGNTVYFTTRDASSTTDDRFSLWATDGSAGGTRLLGSDVRAPTQPVEFEGQLYFISDRAIWRSDGTSLVRITPQTTAPYGVRALATVQGELYWTTSEAGSATPGTDYAYFNSRGGMHVRYDIPGTIIISNGTYEYGPQRLYVIGSDVWSNFADYNTRRSGWFRFATFVSYTWPGPGPQPVAVTAPPPDSITIGRARYYAFDDGVHGSELWIEDESGQRLLQDINPGPDPSSPLDFRYANGRLLFAATTPAFGRELLRMPVFSTVQYGGGRTTDEFSFGTIPGADDFSGADLLREIVA